MRKYSLTVAFIANPMKYISANQTNSWVGSASGRSRNERVCTPGPDIDPTTFSVRDVSGAPIAYASMIEEPIEAGRARWSGRGGFERDLEVDDGVQCVVGVVHSRRASVREREVKQPVRTSKQRQRC